ncbi:MAG: hypothetical protein K2L41_11200, partial [Muribaculaceae bacterium]|nr:hypothetical protein [Muribaculaceae bacterium]
MRQSLYRTVTALCLTISIILYSSADDKSAVARRIPPTADKISPDTTIVEGGRILAGPRFDRPDTTLTASMPADSVKRITPVDSLPLLPRLDRRGKSRFIREKVDLDAPVNLESTDSVVMFGRNLVFLYGDAQVTYGELKLDAAEVKVDLQTSDVYAMGRADSTGEVTGTPIFEEKGTPYESETMSYNFKSKKGYITNVVTQQ